MILCALNACIVAVSYIYIAILTAYLYAKHTYIHIHTYISSYAVK
jgi:hypothetical protein